MRLCGATLCDFFGDQPPVYPSDGSLLVYSAGASLAVRDARTLALRQRLPIGPPFSKQQAADVPDGERHDRARTGRTVYYAYWLLNPAGQPTYAYLARWSLPSGRRLPTVRLGSGPLLAVSLDRRGHGGDGRDRTRRRHLRRADAAAGCDRCRSRRGRLLPSAAAISPDGATIAIGVAERLGVVRGRRHRRRARRVRGGHTAAVASVAYAPDGRAVMTAGDDGRVIVWDPATGTEAAVLPGPAGHVEDAKVSPDGSTLYTSAVGGVVLAWDLTGRRGFGHSARLDRGAAVLRHDLSARARPGGLARRGQVRGADRGLDRRCVLDAHAHALGSFTIASADDPITALAWSPGGATLAVGAHGGVVQVWDVDGTPRLERTLSGLAPMPELSEAVQSLAFSPDGGLLAGTDKSEGSMVGHNLASPIATLAIWNVGTGTLVAPTASLGAGSGLTGSDDGRRSLATASCSRPACSIGGISVFDPSTGQLLRTLADPGDENISLAFGAGDTLAAGTLGGTVEMWDAATGKRLAPPLLADTAEVTDVAFDQSGGRFVTTGHDDGTIKLWFTAGLQQEGPRLPSDADSTAAAAFEPGGGGLVVVDDRGGAFTWPTSPAAWEHRACSVAGRNLTRAEWRELVGGPRYTTVCP